MRKEVSPYPAVQACILLERDQVDRMLFPGVSKSVGVGHVRLLLVSWPPDAAVQQPFFWHGDKADVALSLNDSILWSSHFKAKWLLVGCLTLDFGSGHDLSVTGLSPASGSMLSVSMPSVSRVGLEVTTLRSRSEAFVKLVSCK
ncbi:uncharacterized protein LOC144294672 isoform X2 [Canis aureus]